jgi:hypothetical protein
MYRVIQKSPHTGINLMDWQFPGYWIGRRGPMEWLPRSPNLTPLDSYL